MKKKLKKLQHDNSVAQLTIIHPDKWNAAIRFLAAIGLEATDRNVRLAVEHKTYKIDMSVAANSKAVKKAMKENQ